MLVIPGAAAKNDCDRVTRRDLLRVGGSGVLGVTLGDLFPLQKASANNKGEAGNGPGFGKAKSVIFIYLQGGPSHLDLWDPKDNVPDKVKSVFKHQQTKLAGTHVTELLPKLAQVLDKTTLMRAMVGLAAHELQVTVTPDQSAYRVRGTLIALRKEQAAGRGEHAGAGSRAVRAGHAPLSAPGPQKATF